MDKKSKKHNFYAILEVPKSSSAAEIKSAYKKLALVRNLS